MHYIIDIFRFGAPYLRRYWLAFALGITFGVLYGFSNGAVVWGTKTILDRFNPPSIEAVTSDSHLGMMEKVTFKVVDPWLPRTGRPIDGRQIIGGLLFLPLLVGLRGLGQYLSAIFMASMGERTVNDLRADVLEKLQSLSLDYFNRTSMGDLLQRINGDTAALNQCLSNGFMDSVKEPFSMIGITIALCAIDWKLTIAALILTPLCLIPISTLGQESAGGGGDRSQGHHQPGQSAGGNAARHPRGQSPQPGG